MHADTCEYCSHPIGENRECMYCSALAEMKTIREF
jgi:hypothetical protein